MDAADNGNLEVVRALLTVSGIDVNKKVSSSANFGRTALGLAVHKDPSDGDGTRRNKAEIAALLRAAGAGMGTG